ncbi:DUF4258 domain-containing protein [Chroococcidiopsis sp. FACHB-1243]|nr:DUF4258 domain-containing protein [Chroococcidiopsis sp. [FACHB-1243]]
MNYKLSRHAQRQIAARGISLDLIQSVMVSPGQVVPDTTKGVIYQSKFTGRSGTTFLLRVCVDDSTNPVTVKTVYVTNKIGKYWREA